MSVSLTRGLCAAAVALSLLGSHGTARAQIEPFIGQIMCAGFSFAPRGWMELNGQILSISQNTALFSLLGTQYGGDGRTTFALPNMQGRMLLHAGQSPGLSDRVQGEIGGQEAASLNVSELPTHSHSLIPLGSISNATQISPSGGVPASKARTTLYAPGPGTVAMAPLTTLSAGGSQPVSKMQPYLVVRCFMAVEGIFPSRP